MDSFDRLERKLDAVNDRVRRVERQTAMRSPVRRTGRQDAGQGDAARDQVEPKQRIDAGRDRDQPVRRREARNDVEDRASGGDQALPPGRETRGGGPEDVVRRYATSLNAGRVDEHMSLYAPRLKRWFLKGEVSAGEIRRYKEREWADSPSRVRMRNLKSRPLGPGRVEVTFNKEWDTRGRQRWQGELVGTMELQRYGNTWKIVSERDRRVFWQKRS